MDLYGPEMERLITETLADSLRDSELKSSEKAALIRAWLTGYGGAETAPGAADAARGRDRLAQTLESLRTPAAKATPKPPSSGTPSPPDAGTA